ncbi:MAG: tetratricopeptide repeat protein [Aggregatilineales bacterium]
MSNELIESVRLVDTEGVPSFIFTTQRAETLENLFRLFPLSIATLDVDTWRQMPLPPEIIIPEDASLRIEFSLDDVQSGQLLWEMYISGEIRWSMSARNLKSKTLNIRIQDKSSGKISQIPGNQSPYILGWSGTGGLVYAIRSTHRPGRGWEKNNAYQIIAGIEEQIKKSGGFVTTLHAHMGLIYRELGEFDKAKKCYVQEIRGARREDGFFTTSAMHGFNNLAVIYKKEQNFDKASNRTLNK